VWTNIDGNSVLVAGGFHGQVKVILPRFSMCISKFDAHDSPISCLVFHPKYPEILLTASNDGSIKIWRLKFKESVVDIEWECSQE
jgi:WD40 repeat protein